MTTLNIYLLRPRERLRSIVMSMSVCVCLSVCVSVCLSARISPEPHARSLHIFAHVVYGRAWLSVLSGTLTIGRIAYRREGGDGSAQRGRNVIYDCLVTTCDITTDRVSILTVGRNLLTSRYVYQSGVYRKSYLD